MPILAIIYYLGVLILGLLFNILLLIPFGLLAIAAILFGLLSLIL